MWRSSNVATRRSFVFLREGVTGVARHLVPVANAPAVVAGLPELQEAMVVQQCPARWRPAV
jgi:hypothetical protein